MPARFVKLGDGSSLGSPKRKKKGSSKVMTPRNVELPMHALVSGGAGAGSSMAMLNNGSSSNGRSNGGVVVVAGNGTAAKSGGAEKASR